MALVCCEIAADIFAAKKNLAFAGREEAGDHFDGGAFAGTVGAEIAEDVMRFDAEGNVGDGGDAGVAFGEVFDFEHGDLAVDSILHSQGIADLKIRAG
jgi:hypothetical protein